MWQPESGPVRPRARTAHLCAVLAAVALGSGACTQDTLYPEEGVEGPGFTLVPHVVSVSTTVPERMELDDTARVVVTARVREGSTSTISRIGGTVLVMSPTGRDTTAFSLGPQAVSNGQLTQSFPLTLDSLVQRGRIGALTLPDTLTVEVHAFAITDRGSCAAAVESREQQLPCVEVNGRQLAELDTVQPARSRTIAVSGNTAPLPVAAGSIGDMAVHTATERVFLSNASGHRVEVVNARTLAFGAPVSVGSEPWGLAMSRPTASGPAGDTLIVANSGGINVSFIPLGDGTLREAVDRRFEIPRITLFEVPFKLDSTVTPAVERYGDPLFFNYADRPQFVAQDHKRRLLYSAITTEAAPVGTIRVASWEPGWDSWDARLLFHDKAIFSDSTSYAIANADDVDVFTTGVVIIHDHVPGMVPRTRVSSDPLPVLSAVANLNAKCVVVAGRPCDVWARRGKWRLPEGVELSDTTFVAASGNHEWVAFGEGARTPAGRIILWDAKSDTLSQVMAIADIVNNTSDRIRGVDLNGNGTLGLARGTGATYFFGNDLRLQGLSRPTSGAGAAFQPGSATNRTLAFAGTGRGSIQILETLHYTAVGEVHIREDVVGPFRVAPPLPGTNACPADLRTAPADCIVARAYGVTAAGGIVAVDILRSFLDTSRLP